MTSRNPGKGEPSLKTLEIEQEDSWRWGILWWASRALPQHPRAPSKKLLPGLNLSIYAALQLEPLPVVNKWLPDFRNRGTGLCFSVFIFYGLLFVFLCVCLSVSVFVQKALSWFISCVFKTHQTLTCICQFTACKSWKKSGKWLLEWNLNGIGPVDKGSHLKKSNGLNCLYFGQLPSTLYTWTATFCKIGQNSLNFYTVGL